MDDLAIARARAGPEGQLPIRAPGLPYDHHANHPSQRRLKLPVSLTGLQKVFGNASWSNASARKNRDAQRRSGGATMMMQPSVAAANT
ncbi:hypothetical protein NL676_033716 [Syzygium grande]|nr:hypothetical protein NL676_033716 [Syzygium grande]